MLAPGHPCLPGWVAGEESSRHSCINQAEAVMLVEVSSLRAFIYLWKCTLIQLISHRVSVLLIDSKYRTTGVIFDHAPYALLVRLKESARHRHRLSADLEKELSSQTEVFFSPFSCIPETGNYLEESRVLSQCTGSICKGKGRSEFMF